MAPNLRTGGALFILCQLLGGAAARTRAPGHVPSASDGVQCLPRVTQTPISDPHNGAVMPVLQMQKLRLREMK